MKLGPSFLQKPLAWLITSLRARKTEEMYRIIGGRSPIIEITNAQAEALEKALNEPAVSGQGEIENSSLITHHSLPFFKVYLGMRYWHPLIEDSLGRMHGDGIRSAIALSLYPHYSLATSGSALSTLIDSVKSYPLEVSSIPSWFDHPLYIEALVDVIKKGMRHFHGDADVLFSAHSLPLSIVESGDPYVEHITGTIDAVRKKIDMRWHLSYQSKSGPVRWLSPTTKEKITELARKGVKNLLVVPISFVSDHIETLFEIDILYKKLAEGFGIRFVRAESLNTHPLFIGALRDMVMKRAHEMGW